jgi:hypothetical protein
MGTLTMEEYREILEEQEHKCGICGGIFSKPPIVDRNQVTHDVRGLLCQDCYKGLLAFGANAELLQGAIEYLYD